MNEGHLNINEEVTFKDIFIKSLCNIGSKFPADSSTTKTLTQLICSICPRAKHEDTLCLSEKPFLKHFSFKFLLKEIFLFQQEKHSVDVYLGVVIFIYFIYLKKKSKNK